MILKHVYAAAALVFATAFPAASFAQTAAAASDPLSAFYVAADGDYAGVNYSGGVAKIANDTLLGGDADVGFQLFPNVAVEAGYVGLWSKDTALNPCGIKQAVNASIHGGTADAIVSVPLIGPIDLLGDAGLTYLNGDVSQGHQSIGAYAWGWRAGGGVQWHVTDSLALRVRGLYDQANFTGTSGAIVVSAGLAYRL